MKVSTEPPPKRRLQITDFCSKLTQETPPFHIRRLWASETKRDLDNDLQTVPSTLKSENNIDEINTYSQADLLDLEIKDVQLHSQMQQSNNKVKFDYIKNLNPWDETGKDLTFRI